MRDVVRPTIPQILLVCFWNVSELRSPATAELSWKLKIYQGFFKKSPFDQNYRIDGV